MASDIKSTFTGTGMAIITPFAPDLSVDFAALEKIIERGIAGGVDYLAVLGTTGEPVTLSKQEKKEVLAFVKKVNKGRLPIMYGLGGNHTAEVLETVKETDFEGINAILSVCPYYNKPSQEGVFKHYTALADACPVPVLLYNIPGRSGINMAVNTIQRLSSHPNIMGIKEASGDLTQCMEIAKFCTDQFLLVAGDDLMAVPMIAIGGSGSIAVLPNLFPETFSGMIKAAIEGDFENARRILFTFTEINPLLYAEGNPVGAKAVLKLQGMAEKFVRLPLSEASPELTAKLKIALDRMSVAV
jgi:4-hydroxy-tetrahydrodipicolinate synthase